MLERGSGVQLLYSGCRDVGLSRARPFLKILNSLISNIFSSLLIIAHLTVLELFHHPLEMTWTVHVRRPNNCGASAYSNSPIESCPLSFSSASTLYERDASRSSSRRPTIRRKPVPQSTSPSGNYQNHPAPFVISDAISRERQAEYPLRTLPNGNINDTNGTAPLEQTISVPKCSCGHINRVSPRSATHSPVPKRTGIEKVASRNRFKKASLFLTRYCNLLKISRLFRALTAFGSIEHRNGAVIANQRFSPTLIPPPHKWNNSRTASLAELLPVTPHHDPRSKPLDMQTQTRIRRRDKKNPLVPQPRGETFPLSPARDPYAIEVPGAYTNYRLR